MFCRMCGSELPNDSKFCTNCGARIEQIAKPAPTASPEPASEPAPSPAPVHQQPVKAQPKKKKSGWIWAIVAVAVIAVIVGVMLFRPSPSGSGPSLPLPEIVKKDFMDDTAAINEKAASVVLLSCYDKRGNLLGTGSGFAAFEDGVIVTNFHVIDGGVHTVKGELENGMSFTIDRVLAFDEANDVAILSTQAGTGLTILQTGDSESAAKGDNILAIGYPLGMGNTVSTGIISSIYEDYGSRIIQITAPISPGSSGGALFNDKGEVIGITFASMENGQNMNYAVPIETVEDIWNRRNTSQILTIADVSSPGAITVSELCADPWTYNEQEIIVEGYIKYGVLDYYLVLSDSAVKEGIITDKKDRFGVDANFAIDNKNNKKVIKVEYASFSSNSIDFSRVYQFKGIVSVERNDKWNSDIITILYAELYN